MLRDVIWMMRHGDKEGTGTVTRPQCRSLLIKFRNHIRDQGGIVALIKAIDKDGSGSLNDDEIRNLLQRATGAQPEVITDKDVARARELGIPDEDDETEKGFNIEIIAKAVVQVCLGTSACLPSIASSVVPSDGAPKYSGKWSEILPSRSCCSTLKRNNRKRRRGRGGWPHEALDQDAARRIFSL